MSQCRPDIIFVLAGQSNMAGRGDLGLAEPPDPDILMLSGEDGQVGPRPGHGMYCVGMRSSLRVALSLNHGANLSDAAIYTRARANTHTRKNNLNLRVSACIVDTCTGTMADCKGADARRR